METNETDPLFEIPIYPSDFQHTSGNLKISFPYKNWWDELVFLLALVDDVGWTAGDFYLTVSHPQDFAPVQVAQWLVTLGPG